MLTIWCKTHTCDLACAGAGVAILNAISCDPFVISPHQFHYCPWCKVNSAWFGKNYLCVHCASFECAELLIANIL